MQEVMAEVFSTIVSLAVGGLIGYVIGCVIGYVITCVIAYVTGLRAMRKGMQLILRASLNDMYVCFHQNPPTAKDK